MKNRIATRLRSLLTPADDMAGGGALDFARDYRLELFMALLALAIIPLCGFMAFLVSVDWDEWQILIAANAVAKGSTLYLDVWDNHGPLLTWVLAGLIKLFDPASHEFIYFARGGMFLCQLATLLLAFFLVMRFVPGPRLTAILSVFFIGASPVFALKGVEIRGDNPMVVVWMLALVLWFWAWTREKLLLYFLSGLAVGACFFFSIKTLFLGVAAGTMFLVDMAQKRRLEWKPLLAFGLGSATSVAVLAVLLLARGSFADFWVSYIGQNADRPRPDSDDGYKSLKGASADWMNSVFAALVYTTIQSLRRKAPRSIAILAPCGIFLIIQYLFLIPTHHLQSVLVAIPVVSVLMAWSLLDLIRILPLGILKRPGLWRRGLFIAAILASIYAFIEHTDWEDLGYLNDEIEYADFLQGIIGKEAYLFDGLGVPLFNPRPTEYYSFVHTVRERLESGELELDIASTLDEKDVPYLLVDERVVDLPSAVREFATEHYLPMRWPPLWAAGKLLVHPEGSTFNIRIPGTYYYSADEGEVVLRIDGKTAANPVRLEEGVHTAEWKGGAAVGLCVLEPGVWMPVKDMEDFDAENWIIKKH